MKKSAILTSILLATATVAQAGGPEKVQPEPALEVPAATKAHDWSGFYVGLGYGSGSGEVNYFTPNFPNDLNSGTITSFFFGYLQQNDNLVYGGEVAMSRGSDLFAVDPVGVAFPTENADEILDIKAKVGWAEHRALIYGVLGYSRIDYVVPVVPGSHTTSGLAYGVGVDFAATDRVTVGLEYLARKTDGASFNAGQTVDLNLNTLSARVGFSF